MGLKSKQKFICVSDTPYAQFLKVILLNVFKNFVYKTVCHQSLGDQVGHFSFGNTE
jgi:hypothetical protein